jgi:hypothetical protein
VYRRAGFNLRTVLMDREFEKLKDIMPTIECNKAAAEKHMSEAKHSIKTMKKRIRGLIA